MLWSKFKYRLEKTNMKKKFKWYDLFFQVFYAINNLKLKTKQKITKFDTKKCGIVDIIIRIIIYIVSDQYEILTKKS